MQNVRRFICILHLFVYCWEINIDCLYACFILICCFMSIMWVFHTNEVVTITSFDLCSAPMVNGKWYIWLSDIGRLIRKTSVFCSYWRALSNLLMLTSCYVIRDAGIEPASYLLQSERPIYHVLCFIRLLIWCLKGENVKQLTIARIHKFLIEYQQFKPWNLKTISYPFAGTPQALCYMKNYNIKKRAA